MSSELLCRFGSVQFPTASHFSQSSLDYLNSASYKQSFDSTLENCVQNTAAFETADFQQSQVLNNYYELPPTVATPTTATVSNNLTSLGSWPTFYNQLPTTSWPSSVGFNPYLAQHVAGADVPFGHLSRIDNIPSTSTTALDAATTAPGRDVVQTRSPPTELASSSLSARPAKRARSPLVGGDGKVSRLDCCNVATVKPVSRSGTPLEVVSSSPASSSSSSSCSAAPVGSRTYLDISNSPSAAIGGRGTATSDEENTTENVLVVDDQQPADNLVCHPTINLEQLNSGEDPAVLEADKKSIERHPLFSLLLNLFERLEKCTSFCSSTVSPAVSSTNNPVPEEPPWATSLILSDVEAFVRLRPTRLHCGNQVVDDLVLNAIQVLRIHLLEIEKVHSLCRDFCEKYVQSLRIKITSERLLGSLADEASVELSPSATMVPVSSVDHQPTATALFPMVDTSQRLMPSALHPSTSTLTRTAPSPSSLLDFDSIGGESKRVKRGVLPKYATQVMKSWLFQHIVHPYPSEEEKRKISQQTGLTLLQVNNWFINARRRILQPMLDSNNPEVKSKRKSEAGSQSDGSLSSSQRRSFQRYWSPELAKGQLASGVASKSPLPVSSAAINDAVDSHQHDTDEQSFSDLDFDSTLDGSSDDENLEENGRHSENH